MLQKMEIDCIKENRLITGIKARGDINKWLFMNKSKKRSDLKDIESAGVKFPGRGVSELGCPESKKSGHL